MPLLPLDKPANLPVLPGIPLSEQAKAQPPVSQAEAARMLNGPGVALRKP